MAVPAYHIDMIEIAQSEWVEADRGQPESIQSEASRHAKLFDLLHAEDRKPQTVVLRGRGGLKVRVSPKTAAYYKAKAFQRLNAQAPHHAA